jgi:hypothetical protein
MVSHGVFRGQTWGENGFVWLERNVGAQGAGTLQQATKKTSIVFLSFLSVGMCLLTEDATVPKGVGEEFQ